MRRAAARTSALLSLLFIVTYGATNAITWARPDVGTAFFAWERLLPFIPWLIVPYMSLDLFFVGAPFLCRSDAERRTLARRIACAILVAGTMFLLFPLRLAAPRPEVSGALGSIFRVLHGFDQPVNLVPSLHIALCTILARTYARHSRGPLRALIHAWFGLIGVSTLLTFQHHVIDVVTGFLLAALCFHLFPEQATARVVPLAPRMALYYGAGAALTLVAASWLRPWGVVLVWPGIALALVCAAYCGLGPAVLGKDHGRVSLFARVLLAPYFFGQELSRLYYGRQCRAWDEVARGVWIGRKLNDAEAAEATRLGVTAVVDLTAEFSEARPFVSLAYRNIAVLDLTAPTPDQLDAATEFLREHSAHGTVYVHCKIGYSRSAAVVGAFLLEAGACRSVGEAVARMRAARPSLVVRPEALEALHGVAERVAARGLRPGIAQPRGA